MKKSLLAIIILGVMLFGFTGCRKGNDAPAKEYAHVAEYTEFAASFDYVSALACQQDTLSVVGSSWDEETGVQSTSLCLYDFTTSSLKELPLTLGEDAHISQIAVANDGNLFSIVNNNEYEVTKDVSVWYMGMPKECVMKRLMLTTQSGYTTEEADYPVQAGKVHLVLPPLSAIVLRYEKPEKERKED